MWSGVFMRLRSIKLKFFILIMCILIPVISFQIVRLNTYKDQLIQRKLISNIRLSKAIASSFESYIDNLWTQIDITSKYILNNPNLTSEDINKYLNEIVDMHGAIHHLFWLDNNGNIISSSNPVLLEKSLKHREYVARIMSGDKKVLSNIVFNSDINKLVLPMAVAVNSYGELKNIIIATINIDKMGAQFSNLLFDEDEIFSLIDNKGTIVYQNGHPNIYMKSIKISDNSPSWGALEGQLIKSEKTFVENEEIYRLGCSYPIGKTRWALSVYSKYENVVSYVNNEINKAIALFVIMLFLSFVIAFIMGGYLLTPIIKLKNTAYRIMNGDYSARTDITGYDEIAITAQTFDNMAESIEKNDVQKSQLFINLSHELKTPLNVIMASLQLIDKFQTRKTDCIGHEKILEQLSMMKQNCYRLIRMVSNIIDLSKHDNGYLKLTLKNYNIVSIIEDITMSIVEYAKIKKIEVLFDTDTEEKIIAIDPDAIERIMLNLISNAIKFTNEGGLISVSIFDKKDKVVISVKDTGIGIPPDSIDSIFERFKQVNNTLCKNCEGSGIGLSMVKALVESHGGTIYVKSVLNQGSEFVIELPAKLLEEDSGEHYDCYISQNNIAEKINLEFSDIYDIK